ncbi:MAG: hypothetical protein IPK33_23435 [Gemmatimonadetes bacterium]|nr:hypothetical protein [Gemmatimonadota bacterium]
MCTATCPSPIPGETVVGSAIALFSAAEAEVLDVLERIEVAEGLPHPTIDGTWFKRSPRFGQSYLISTFGEGEVDEMLAHTRRAGLMSLYHEGPFKSWGHFIVDSAQFPSGRAGLKGRCGEGARSGSTSACTHSPTSSTPTTRTSPRSPTPG